MNFLAVKSWGTKYTVSLQGNNVFHSLFERTTAILLGSGGYLQKFVFLVQISIQCFSWTVFLLSCNEGILT